MRSVGVTIRTTFRTAQEDTMSAAVNWGPTLAPVPIPWRTARPRLRLVAPGERVSAPARPAIRLSRRGRLLITLMVAASVLSLTVVHTTLVSAAAPQIDHATTVSAGQTLSEVAAAQLPRLPVNEAVAHLQLANGLNSTQVHAGQSLLIPAMP
jgi:LysM domain